MSISGKVDPVVRPVAAADIAEALVEGLRDFQALPLYGLCFVIWMYQVRLLIALLLGLHASFSSLQEFMTVVLTTNEGLLFLAIGNAVGAALSLILFSLTVVSFPLLLDREVDVVTAMVTSVRAVVTSPLPMIGLAAVIVMLLIVSALPYFLGLVVTLPVLGHTTWHLYRRLVVPVS
ncbi:DUF2189 domain-containing protein [Bradyrhizobium genosp. A]|uniref:DUF2189 domain-containing protein n=1 Tax=Bradyrhizobium genosp. A TaxID=83626 RepID=UPI003CF3057C